MFVVLVVGIAVRVVLIPITHGQDFVVWDRATIATLRGSNVYANHPNYPGGPFAYFPLFLYLELPFQWMAQHTGISFTILGKLPMLAGDVTAALLIARGLGERGCRAGIVALGAALFFLNPLVLYNSAYYGRFDSIGCALLLLATRQLSRVARKGGLWYALAVVTKTFPVFLLPAILRAARGARTRVLLTLAVATVAVSLPYLKTWGPYLNDIVVYDATKTPQYLSWQRLLLHVLDADTARRVSYFALALGALGAVMLARRVRLELAVALTFVLFLLVSKVVLDQYLTWPLPWLILTVWTRPRRVSRASAALVLIFTMIGSLANATFHPFGRSAWWIEIGLGSCCAGYLLIVLTARPEQGTGIRAFPPTVVTRSPVARLTPGSLHATDRDT